MASDGPGGPSFRPGRPIRDLVVPVGGTTGEASDGSDGHRRALTVATTLAEAWGLPIRLLHVGPSIASDDPVLTAVAAEAAGRWPTATIATTHVHGDDPAIAAAGEIDADDLAVVATEHADGWSFKHSVAEALVERVGEPVLLVGPRAGRTAPSGDVVVALDGSPVAEAALAAGMALARSLGVGLWLVRVVADEPPGPEPAPTRLHPEIGVELQRLIDRIDPALRPRWEVVHANDPVPALIGVADHLGAGYLVAGTRGRTDESRTTMCSISMGLVAAASHPVLVVHGDTGGVG